MSLATYVREYVLDLAVRTNRLPAERRPIYRAMYDRDPSGTLQLLQSLAPGVPPETMAALASFAEQPPYPRELFPELVRRPRAALARTLATVVQEPLQPLQPSPAAAEASLPDTAEVAVSAEQLFPEVRERKAQRSRVTRAGD